MKEPLRRVTRFYLLAFGLSWLGMLPLLLGWRGRGWLLGLILPGVGPAVAAWLADRRTFLAFRIPVRGGGLLLAAAIPPALLWMGNWASFAFEPQRSPVSPPVWGWPFAAAVAMALAANIWEETGWRCCGLRLLQGRYRPWMASGVVGILWAAWHVPLFLWPGLGMQRYPFGWWALSAIGTSFVMAWLWNRTGGSVWGVTVYHVASNIAGAGLGVRSYCFKALVDCAAAAVLLVWTRGSLRSSVQRDPYENTQPLPE